MKRTFAVVNSRIDSGSVPELVICATMRIERPGTSYVDFVTLISMSECPLGSGSTLLVPA